MGVTQRRRQCFVIGSSTHDELQITKFEKVVTISKYNPFSMPIIMWMSQEISSRNFTNLTAY